MNNPSKVRRQFLTSSTTAITAGALSAGVISGGAMALPSQLAQAGPAEKSWPKFRYCLNTSTINGSEVPVREQIQIASKAGYDAIELWLRDVTQFVEQGGKVAELAKEIADLGLGLDSAIAFGSWLVDDEQKRKQGLEQCRRDMEIVRDLGGHRIAAPPVGATGEPKIDLDVVAQRYVRLIEIGAECDVAPQVELWGFSSNMAKLQEVLYVAAAANHPNACLLLDVYHMYKGGSDFTNIGFVPGTKLHCLHMNDYPATPALADIKDADRVYPGDGVAPIAEILHALVANGFHGTLSLELFNREYWKLPALEVAKTGLEKMKRVSLPA
ncbi:MAG: sugar phosphate isomerase/epimerase family protein [Pirellulaceae bacterium]|jgi:2-keto-myo-inositol isomerase